jgi:hypothetical protein
MNRGVEFTLRVNRSEALDVFHKWLSEKSLLRCDLAFSMFVACFKGRVMAVEDNAISLISDDGDAELRLEFTPKTEFVYGDSRRSRDDAELYESVLLVFFGEVTTESEPDMIAFMEINALAP